MGVKFFSFSKLVAGLLAGFMVSQPASADILFKCDEDSKANLEVEMSSYLCKHGVSSSWYTSSSGPDGLRISLNPSSSGTNTLYLKFDPKFDIEDEMVQLPALGGKTREVLTVSKKEILLALLQPGRTTEFKGKGCTLGALQDQVGVRQNFVAWSENLQWGWPEGAPAKWNTQYWDKGTPRKQDQLNTAMTDVFLNPDKYEIGCYTATKFVMVQGILDYYNRVKPDDPAAKVLQERMWSNGDPLVAIEPRKMWSFEEGFDLAELPVPGKLLRLQDNVAPENFVPGDWAYFLNSDPLSYQKTGYEGSNAIYLGRGKFNDHYNDNGGSYLYREKLRVVFNWRHQVFNRARDFNKVEALSEEQLTLLGKTPEEGGFVLPIRAVPYQFNYEELPPAPLAD
ncbi:hypothetical protein LC612_33595 [Nostoc sp. CHAB 5834]|nr:hypothetical protein [Nostoc sp. CHAB 5834]